MEIVLGLSMAYVFQIIFCLLAVKYAHNKGYGLFDKNVVSIPIFLSFIPFLGFLTVILGILMEVLGDLIVGD